MKKSVVFLAFILVLPFVIAAEPDNSPNNASWITTDGTWENHTFEYIGDNDFVKFNATKGSYYLIRTINLTAANITNTEIFLYDTDGSTDLSDDDAGLVGSDWSARIIWRAISNGTYYVRINESNGTAGGSYNISVEIQGVLAPYLVSPSSWTNATKYDFFNFTAGVTCVGGPCYNVRVVLDPEKDDASEVPAVPVTLDREVASAVEEAGEVRVIVKLKDKPVESLTLDDIKKFKKSKKARQLFMQKYKELEADPRKELRQNLKKQIRENQDRVLGELDVVDMKKLRKNVRKKRLAAQEADADFKLKHKYSTVNAFSGVVTKKGLKKLLQNPDVEHISLDRPVNAFLDVSVPLINADDVWNLSVDGLSANGSGQTVCIIDTGINYNHADFRGLAGFPNAKVVGGYCYCDDYTPGDSTGCCPDGDEESTDPSDDHSHGSHCAGIAASEDATYKGVAPGATLVAIKALDSGGSGWMSDVAAGIDWCVNNASSLNISVISMSLGTWYVYDNNGFGCDDFDPTMAQAIDNAVANDIFVAAAAGNRYDSGDKGIAVPGCIKNATSVGITNDADAIVSWGQRGFTLDIMAPGNSIMATDYDGTHATKSGTSMSTPHVAGAAALIQQYFKQKHNRTLAPREIEWLLKFNGKDIPDSVTNMTYTRIDTYAAVTAKGAVSTTVGATPFYTTSANPHDSSCLVSMADGDSCNVSWLVNATGDLENYTFFVIAETDYTSNTTSRFNITIVDGTPPSLSVVSPADNANVSSALQQFTFNASDESASSVNCSLVFNGSTVNYTVVTSVSGMISYTIPSEGLYLWNISCSDGTNTNISSTRTITYDATSPEITLTSLSNGTVLSNNVSDFIFYATDNFFSTFSCDLYVNGTKSASNSSVANNTNTTFASVSLAAGSLSWNVNCTESASNAGISSSRNLIAPAENATTSVSTTANTTFDVNATANIDINLSTTQNVTGTLAVSQYNVNPENISATSTNGFAALGLGTFVTINASAEIEGNLSWYLLTIYYSTSDLPANTDESTLRIYYFNSTSGQWQQELDSGVDTSANYVWANMTHFSTFSAGGSEQAGGGDDDGGGGGGGGGGGSTASSEPIGVVPTYLASLVEAPKNQEISVSYGSSSYLFKVSDFTNSLLTMRTLPDATAYPIANGMTKSFDLDDDGRFDIQIGYSGKYSNKALVLFYLVQKPEPIALLPPAPRKKAEPVEVVEEAGTAIEEAASAQETTPVVSAAAEPEPVTRESFFANDKMFLTYLFVVALLTVTLFLVMHFFPKNPVQKHAEEEVKKAMGEVKKEEKEKE